MILLADAGNSKTDWRFIRKGLDDTTFRTRGISPYFDTADEIREVFRSVAHQTGTVPEQIMYYGTGCSSPSNMRMIRNILAEVFPEAAGIEVSDDMTGAGIALFGDGEGVVVITGTGSNAGLVQQGQIVHRTTSLGYLLGDEGSGADIGFRFLKALLSDNLPEALTIQLLKDIGTTKQELLKTLYASPKPQTFAASCLRHIVGYKDVPVIREMVLQAFGDLLKMMVLPLLPLAEQREAGFAGSVAALFEAELREVFSAEEVEITAILQEPILNLGLYWRHRLTAR